MWSRGLPHLARPGANRLCGLGLLFKVGVDRVLGLMSTLASVSLTEALANH